MHGEYISRETSAFYLKACAYRSAENKMASSDIETLTVQALERQTLLDVAGYD